MSPYRLHPTSTHYVYRAFDKDGVLLYVGCTMKYRTRMNQHAASSAWWPYAVTFTWKTYQSRDFGLSAEASAIYREHPVFNLAGRTVVQAVARQQRDAYIASHTPAESAA